MSDSPSNPNWWQASDGKWYPPSQPSPQFSKKSSKKKWWIAGGVAVVVVLAIAAASGNDKPKDQKSTGTLTKQASSSRNLAADDVTISRCETDSVLRAPSATVEVLNHSSKPSNYLVTVAFEDPDGSQFDTSIALVNTLAPGQSGSDTAKSLKVGVSEGFTCKITDVTRTAS